MTYQPIENYGIIGNMRTAALIGLDGSIDWLCLPRFDSPSVFGAILDDRIGGRFRIAPATEGLRRKQHYWPDTNILVTRFLHIDGVAEIEDFMPVGGAARREDQVVRRVRVVRGRMPFLLECFPAFDYARARHRTTISRHGARFDAPGLSLALAASVPLQLVERGASAEFTLGEGEEAVFVLRMVEPDAPNPAPIDAHEASARFHETVDYWQRWVMQCTYNGRWRETVQRSALVLKLLTYAPTGAIIAAPTTSLPEGLGGVRNWDYRYTWIRDAAFTIYALIRIGFTEEATRFFEWLQDRWRERRSRADSPLQLMYTVDGQTDLREEELGHLDGYMSSRPVRIGNGAHAQLQLDIYGELMDAAYLHNKHAAPVGYEAWLHLRDLVDWVADNWGRKDAGIWESRGGPRDHVYSRFMCWVALDRGLRLAEKRSFPAPRVRWLAARDAVYEDVMKNGWNEQMNSFVRTYDSDALDASLLLMPLTFFMAPNDPRMLATIDAIKRAATHGGLAVDGLLYRYLRGRTEGDVHGPEGTFNLCTFWLVEAQTRAGRTDRARLADARMRFEQMLGFGNHLGLFSEQTGLSGEALGNFPQAFTHLSLISAAFNLDRELLRRPAR